MPVPDISQMLFLCPQNKLGCRGSFAVDIRATEGQDSFLREKELVHNPNSSKISPREKLVLAYSGALSTFANKISAILFSRRRRLDEGLLLKADAGPEEPSSRSLFNQVFPKVNHNTFAIGIDIAHSGNLSRLFDIVGLVNANGIKPDKSVPSARSQMM